MNIKLSDNQLALYGFAFVIFFGIHWAGSQGLLAALGAGICGILAMRLLIFLALAFKSLPSFVAVATAIGCALYFLDVEFCYAYYGVALFAWVIYLLALLDSYRHCEDEFPSAACVGSFADYYKYHMYLFDGELSPAARGFLAVIDKGVFMGWGESRQPVERLLAHILMETKAAVIVDARALRSNIKWTLYSILEEDARYSYVSRRDIERFFLEYLDWLVILGEETGQQRDRLRLALKGRFQDISM